MSDHNLAEQSRKLAACQRVMDLIDTYVERPNAGNRLSIREALWELAAHEKQAEQQAGEAVGACLKVIKGELCYRSRDEDQSFGMWVPVAPDSDHGFNNGAKFAPVAAHPQQPLSDEQAEAGRHEWLYSPAVPNSSAFVCGVRFAERAHGIGITKDTK